MRFSKDKNSITEMADDFKTYDKAPIIGVVNFKHWSFALRELILGFIALVLLVMCMIFVGLYASNSKSDVLEHIQSPAAFVQKEFCVTKDCMSTASRSLSLVNNSVDPCDNFYEYACGNYKLEKPLTRQGARSVVWDIYNENEERLEELIESPPRRIAEWAYERKMSHFYQACQDTFRREKLLGRPFLERVVPVLGGWDLLGTWNESTWDLNTMLKKVQTDFWVDALYKPSVEPDYDFEENLIAIHRGGTGKWMYSGHYHYNYLKPVRDAYKHFIRKVGSLLMRDANLVNVTDAQRDFKLDQFVNDTFFMEKKIARVMIGSTFQMDTYHEDNLVSLGSLNQELGGVFDIVDQMSYMFNEAHISRHTKVAVEHRHYLRNVTAMINSLPAANRKRMLHHYLMWRVAEIYVQDLSWEYIHANREIYVATKGYANFVGIRKYCMYQIDHYMNHALSALYVGTHFADESKQNVDDITQNLKKALQTQLDSTPWFDEKTRTYAKNKLDLVTFKMGYPDWMTNVEHIDNMYSSFTIDIMDFFGNLLTGNMFVRKKWNEALNEGENRDYWYYEPYDTAISVYFYWNEIIATAGMMQHPLFNHNAPHFTNFGSLGVRLARYLHHIIDEYGMHHDTRGDLLDKPWWTNSSLQAYAKAEQCVFDKYDGIKQNATFAGETDHNIPINAELYKNKAIAVTSGMRVALKGYRDWVDGLGVKEKMLPGLMMNPNQMILLSYAQSLCYNKHEFHSMLDVYRRKLSVDLQLNMAVGELPEFAEAFQCNKDAKMNHKDRCQYF